MSIKPPNNRRNLDIAINKIQGETSNPIQLRTVLANTIIGQLLPNGAVKGGSSLKFRYGDDATRFSRDFDTARATELVQFITEFEEKLREGWQGFTGRIIRKEPAKPKDVPGEYIMQPFEIKLDYLGKSWATVPLEIGHDEIGDTDEPDFYVSDDIVAVFERLGFTAPKPIALIPLHHQIAQKLHGVSAENSERSHDLIDLQIIVQNETIDFPLVKETCIRLFNYRKLQAWPPLIIKNTNWNSLYEAQLSGLTVLPTVDEAIVWANDLIRRIDN
jgi:hypothetical protein